MAISKIFEATKSYATTKEFAASDEAKGFINELKQATIWKYLIRTRSGRFFQFNENFDDIVEVPNKETVSNPFFIRTEPQVSTASTPIPQATVRNISAGISNGFTSTAPTLAQRIPPFTNEDLRRKISAEIQKNFDEQIKPTLVANLEEKVRLLYKDELKTEAKEEVRDEVINELTAEIYAKAEEEIREKLEDEIHEKYEEELRKSVTEELREELTEEIKDELEYEIKNQIEEAFSEIAVDLKFLLDDLDKFIELSIATSKRGKEIQAKYFGKK